MNSAIFETERLRARRWIASDVEALFAVYSDPEGMRWVGDGQPISRAECDRWMRVTMENYAARGYGMFVLEERTTGEIVGFCGLVHPGGQPEPEIKYALLRSHWGRGLASEIAPALLAYGAERHGLSRIIATVNPEHAVSRRVLAKAGMKLRESRVESDGSVTLVYEWSPPGVR
jgi:RimJ/RimL family protein N-acetyltransferase